MASFSSLMYMCVHKCVRALFLLFQETQKVSYLVQDHAFLTGKEFKEKKAQLGRTPKKGLGNPDLCFVTNLFKVIQ